jgi:PilZ domain
MGAMDRRQHERYELQGPVSFSWEKLGNRCRRRGVLQNISGGGAFVSTDQSPPEGTEIQFRVSFQSLFAESRLVLRAHARVTRVECAAGPEERSGFAAAMGSFTLRNDKNKLIESGSLSEARKNSS